MRIYMFAFVGWFGDVQWYSLVDFVPVCVLFFLCSSPFVFLARRWWRITMHDSQRYEMFSTYPIPPHSCIGWLPLAAINISHINSICESESVDGKTRLLVDSDTATSNQTRYISRQMSGTFFAHCNFQTTSPCQKTFVQFFPWWKYISSTV